MHGSLRFILAITVALSHLGITFYGYNIGVVAVVVFYLLAGMVAYKLISKLYPNQPLNYYKNRVKRIFPLYLLSLLFAYSVYLLGTSSYFLSAKPSYLSYLSNLTIIPLSYYMYTGIDKFTLLPPVWSLGVELQFYLLAPFILLRPKRVIFFSFFSFTIYTLAVIGVLNTDYFGYRLLVGVFFIFLLGTLLQKAILGDNTAKKIVLLLYTATLLLSIYIYNTNYKAPYNHETLFSLLVALPLLYTISKLKLTTYIQIDKYLGILSYPFFLLHFPLLWLAQLFPSLHQNTYLILFTTAILSIAFNSILTIFNKTINQSKK